MVVVVWGAIGFGFQAPQQKRIAALSPDAPTLALNASALYVGTSAGAALGGILSSHWGPGSLGIAGGLVALLGCAFALPHDGS